MHEVTVNKPRLFKVSDGTNRFSFGPGRNQADVTKLESPKTDKEVRRAKQWETWKSLGWIAVRKLKQNEKVKPGVDAPKTLQGMLEDEAVAVITAEKDPAVLASWLRNEQRKGLAEVIKKQLESL